MATERGVPVRLWRCPECKAEAFWPAEPPLPGGPALCGHPSSGYVSTLYVPAVLSEELVEKVLNVQFERLAATWKPGFFVMDPNTWASAMASVSKRGENGHSFHAALDFHMGPVEGSE